MKIIGISAFYHDSSAAIIVDGEIIAAAQEERFSRVKHDSNFPENAIKYCLDQADCRLSNIDYIIFYEKPFLKFERLVETYLAFAPKGFSSFSKFLPTWVGEKLFQKKKILNHLMKIDDRSDFKNKILFNEHHMSHAASAFYPSPFEESLILTMDGVGEWCTTSICYGKGNKVKVLKEINFPHSLGMLYSAFTYYLGFKVNSGEYKLMGLAPYGKPLYREKILDQLINVKEDGSFSLNMKYFNYCTGLVMITSEFESLFELPRRTEQDDLRQIHMDIASSIQVVLEEVVLKICRQIKKEFGGDNLCLAGGVALNCVANGKIEEEKIFKNIWIQPAAGDAGGALGAALYAYYGFLDNKRVLDKSGMDGMKGSYLGDEYSCDEIEDFLDSIGANYRKLTEEKVNDEVTASLLKGSSIGWFQGRMEFGPRALGNRSILADPRSEKTQSILNLKIKYRESFRPFAPSVLREDVSDWFERDNSSPYMLLVSQVAKSKVKKMSREEEELFGLEKLKIQRSEVPAVTHVDYSARVQSVDQNINPRYHRLISTFKKSTGCPLVVNTSFNIRGEPIVRTPKDAFRCFMGTGLDMLVLGEYVLRKEDQPAGLKAIDYKSEFKLD